MLGGGGRDDGVVNAASSQLANERLTAAVDEMQTKEYMAQRDESDVIPTHRHLVPDKPKKESTLKTFAAGDQKEDRSDNDNDDSDDDDLEFIRQRRADAMRKQQDSMGKWVSQMHGTYRDISQEDFFGTVVREKGGSDRVVIHFYHNDFERCAVMDRYLGEVARLMMNTRFVKVNVDKAPFLVDKLKVTTLPCLVLFKDDIAVDRVIGFELGVDVGTEDDAFQMSREALQERLEIGLQIREAE
jgi:hypothetical protein